MSTAPRMIELRSGDAGDLPTIVRLMEESFDPRFGEAWNSGQCLGMLALPGVWLTLALYNDAVSGFALSRVVAGDGELLLIAVHPDMRGRGIGAALLRGAIAQAREHGGERLHLEVREGNDAIALYAAHGFTPVGRRRDYYRGPVGTRIDALTFALTL